MSSTIINYFKLVRIPNIFTTFSNILLGYIFFTNIDHFDFYVIFELISVSAFLYIGGMIQNDYFDIKIDEKERPSRPLPSNKISKKNALILIYLSFSYSIIISFIIGWYTLIITITMVTLISLYNKFLKNTIWGCINMGIIRSLNVLLGASQSIFFIAGGMFDTRFIIPLLSEFLYVSSITILSWNETKNFVFDLQNSLPFIVIYVLIFTIGILIIVGTFNYSTLIPLIIFSCFIIYSHISLLTKIATTQKSVSLLITMIVILDIIFMTDIMGVYFSLILAFVLIIPVIILSRRIYMT
ncbi:MAG TPA: UbiA family prenyltransferase [Nitrososphaeraceae archaeon]